MSEGTSLHEDTFYEYFERIRHQNAHHEIWGGFGLETFGDDLEIIRQFDPEKVWTVVDGESGDQWIVPGFHYVNRVCYLTTTRAHRFIPAEFRVQRNMRSALTPLGLARQLRKVDRLMAECELSTA